MTQTGNLSVINNRRVPEFFLIEKLFHFWMGILLAAKFSRILIEKEFNLKYTIAKIHASNWKLIIYSGFLESIFAKKKNWPRVYRNFSQGGKTSGSFCVQSLLQPDCKHPSVPCRNCGWARCAVMKQDARDTFAEILSAHTCLLIMPGAFVK